MHNKRHWHISNREDQLVFVLFVVPLWLFEPFEEPFVVAASVAVVAIVPAVVVVVDSDQHLCFGRLAWHSKWWLFVAAFVVPVASKWCVYYEVVAAVVVAAAVFDTALYLP